MRPSQVCAAPAFRSTTACRLQRRRCQAHATSERAMSTRYASVDALRGLTVAAMLLVNDPGDWGHVYAPLEHAAWNGCTPTDVIFPLFLFIVGVSIALGSGTGTTSRAGLLRALRIVALGLLLHLAAHLAMGTAAFRPMGVLQRI